MEEVSQIKKVIQFLSETEKCRRNYLPFIARGSAWALALLSASALSKYGLFTLMIAIALYFLVLYLVLGETFKTSKKRFLIILIALLMIIAGGIVGYSSPWGNKIFLLLLLIPTLRRLIAFISVIAHLCIEVFIAILALTMGLLALLYGQFFNYVISIVISEIVFIIAAVKRMIRCSDQALNLLLREGNAK